MRSPKVMDQIFEAGAVSPVESARTSLIISATKKAETLNPTMAFES